MREQASFDALQNLTLVCLESKPSPCKPGRLYWQHCYTFSVQESHEESTKCDATADNRSDMLQQQEAIQLQPPINFLNPQQ